MTLDRLLFDRAGLVQGAVVATQLQHWIGAAVQLGHMPTSAQLGAYLGKTERTGERSRAVVRRHFTEQEFRAIVEQAAALGYGVEFRSIDVTLPATRTARAMREAAA
jgi:transposase